MLNNYSCRSPLESFCEFRKSGENFNLEELKNPILVGCNFTKIFTVDVLWGFSKTPKTISTTVSPGKFIDQLLFKVISLQEKNTGCLEFWRKSKFLFDILQSTKMNNKHSKVLLEFRKNPRKWNYRWSSMLKTCTTSIVHIFKQICCFDEVFLMVLTSTEYLFTERPLSALQELEIVVHVFSCT